MMTKLKVNLWDFVALLLAVLCVFAGILLVVALLWNMPIMVFYAKVILLTFSPVLIIYIWTEKVVQWMNIKSRFLDLIALSVRVIAITMFITFAGSYIISLYKDIPYAVNSNYSQVMGKPVSTVRRDGTGSRAYLAVDGVKFDIGKSTAAEINKSSYLSILYLPNSKFIVNINKAIPLSQVKSNGM